MVHLKQTPRKRTGPKGVPCHRLVAKDDAEASTSKTKGLEKGSSLEERQQVEIASLGKEINELDQCRVQDARNMEALKLKLEKSQECQKLYRKMLETVTNQRDAAWLRENDLQWRNEELSHAIQDADEMAMQYRDMAYELFFQLHPPPENEEDESGIEYEGDDKPDEMSEAGEEEEDPKEMEPVNDDGEDGYVSRDDTDPDE